MLSKFSFSRFVLPTLSFIAIASLTACNPSTEQPVKSISTAETAPTTTPDPSTSPTSSSSMSDATSNDLAVSATSTESAESFDILAPGDWSVFRVAGNPPHELEIIDTQDRAGKPLRVFRAGQARITSPLAEGYPNPTPAGAIELKNYQPYRHAIVTDEATPNGLFFPLFQHISARDIPMTAPVVMTGQSAGEPQAESSMAFLYGSPNMGPTGSAERGVVVEDTAPITVISIGFLGNRRSAQLNTYRQQLEDWLANQTSTTGQWTVAGEPRLLGYNGPDTPRNRRWQEYQLPIQWQQTPN